MRSRFDLNKWFIVACALIIATNYQAFRSFFSVILVTREVTAPPQTTSTVISDSSFKDCPSCPTMLVIPPGEFLMGHDQWRKHEKPVHLVQISQQFAIGQTEITQQQWKSVMGVNPSRHSKCGEECPVDWISWLDIQKFLQRLNAKTGKNYRLPSEAEWEYACRAGQIHEQCGGNDLDAVAWYLKNSLHAGKTGPSPVAHRRENAWGLFDMSGNVSEWTADCWNPSYEGAPSDGSTWTSGDCTMRPLRGGSHDFTSFLINAANRGRAKIEDRSSSVGLRVARDMP